MWKNKIGSDQRITDPSVMNCTMVQDREYRYSLQKDASRFLGVLLVMYALLTNFVAINVQVGFISSRTSCIVVEIAILGYILGLQRKLKPWIATVLFCIVLLIGQLNLYLVYSSIHPEYSFFATPWVHSLVLCGICLSPFSGWIAIGCYGFAASIGHIIHHTVIQSMTKSSTISLVVAESTYFLIVLITGSHIKFHQQRQAARTFSKIKGASSTYRDMSQSFKEQEKLLLSVLPRHVASEMTRDIGTTKSSQFRKIYMNRYENVSILFADIVGFTALSCVVSSEKLITILNDLFASFDDLAKKYKQLRIKILGDCYYCICGAPEPIQNHAALSIEMGLEMIGIIKDVARKSKCGVNMRVGIHTGAVLAGVLGQVRWQYDVLGKEVTLANKMESTGIPGKVHISESTAQCVRDQYTLEETFVGKYEEEIKMRKMKTFVVKTTKEAQEKRLDSKSQKRNSENIEEKHLKNESSSLVQHVISSQSPSFTSRLSLKFKDKVVDELYRKYREVTFESKTVHCLVVAIIYGLSITAYCSSFKLNIGSIVVIISSSVLILILTCKVTSLCIDKESDNRFCRIVQHNSTETLWKALPTVTAVLLFIYCTFQVYVECYPKNVTTRNSSDHNNSTHSTQPIFEYECSNLYLIQCQFFLVCATLLNVPKLKWSTFVMSLCALLIVTIVIFSFLSFKLSPEPSPNTVWYASFAVQTFVFIGMTTISCSAIKYQVEKFNMSVFIMDKTVDDIQHEALEMKQKNNALLQNLLPIHVLKTFTGSDVGLYSQAYDNVGVMFAACPSFNDFYNESKVNNNGLECIRLLNEIFSDFDDLLALSNFCNVTKIKTIGSTYMAASGLNKEDDAITRNRSNVVDIVEFTYALILALDKINKQSFNSFQLRTGISCGPVLAGIIGSDKPHYDIWGNTVNVASRMESTGYIGKIQVHEETMAMLQGYNYEFEKRGLIKVKGKGELTTYFIKKKVL